MAKQSVMSSRPEQVQWDLMGLGFYFMSVTHVQAHGSWACGRLADGSRLNWKCLSPRSALVHAY